MAVDDLTVFREELRRAEQVLYLGDNAGEIVFDRVLVEEIVGADRQVAFAVKSRPILNDATFEDARAVGMDRLIRVIETGSGEIGVPLARCSDAFRSEFAAADLIISKGQGNFETLSDEKRHIFYLFMAKCPVVAKHIGCDIGDIILLSNK